MDNLHIPITGDNQGFINALNGAREGVRNAARDIEQSGMSIEQMFGRIQKAAALSLAGFSAKEFVQKVVQIRGEFQQLEVAFTTMLGNAQKANALMQQLTKTAAVTPFDLQGVASGAKQLLAYGIEAEKVNDTLVHLGDIAAGLSLPLTDLVYLYGTTMVQGRMFTRDLLQFQNRGIPIAEELAKVLGVTKDKVGELITAGKVGAKEFNDAIMAMSSEGGKFGGLMEAQSKTITGQISNIEDAIDVMFNNIGKSSEGIINDTLSVISSLVENYEKVGEVIASAISVYGVYKAAVMTVTAMQTLQTAGVGALTVAETVHYGWLVLVQKAQALLNATMLANPYVLVATAVAALVAVMVTMKDEQDLINDATEEYNKTKDEAIKKEEEHANEIERLCRIAGDESLSTENRRLALVQLEQQYPSIFATYDTEYAKLSNILAIKKEIAALDGKTSVKNPTNELDNVNRRINELEKKGAGQYRQYVAGGVAVQSGGRTREEEAELQMLQQKRQQLQNQIHKANADNYLANLTGISNPDLEKQINERRNLLAKMQTTGKKYGRVQMGGATGVYNENEIQGQLQILEAEQKRRKDIITNGARDFVAEARKAYKAEEAELKKLRSLTDPKKRAQSNMQMELGGKMMKVSEMTADQFADAVKKQQEKVDEAAKKIKGLTGQSVKGGNSAAKKEQAERERNQRAYENAERAFAKVKENLTMELSQSFVDIEEDTKARELAQIKHDHEQEMAEFEREKEEYIRQKIALEEAKAKKDGKTYTKPTDTNSVLSEEEQRQFDQWHSNLVKKQEKEIRDFHQAEIDAMNMYLEEYGTYQQQKLAIAKQYAERIRKAQTEGEKLSLNAEMNNKIAAIDANQMALNVDWSQAFSGVGNVLKDIANETLDRVEKFMQTDEFKKLTPEGKKSYTDLAANLRREGAGQETSPFNFKIWGTITENVKTYQQAVRDLQAAEEAHTLAVEKRRKAEEELAKAVTDDAKRVAQANLDAAQAEEDETARKQREANEKKNQANRDLQENTEKASNGLANFANAVNEMSNGSLYGFANGVTKLITSIGGASKGLSELGGKIGGIIGAILQIIDALGDDPAQFIRDLLDKVAKVIEKVLSDLPNLIGNVIGGVFNIVGGVVSGVGKLFGFDMDGIFGGSTEAFDNAVEKWGWLLDTWKDNLAYEKELMKEAYGTKVTDIQQKTEADLRRSQQAAAEIYRGWAGSGAGWFSHSNGYEANRDANCAYLWQYDQELAKRMGASLHHLFGNENMPMYVANGDISNLFNLTAKELKELKHNNSQFWQSLSEEARKYLDQVIELEDEIEQLRKEAMEQLTATSFDTMVSDFQSKLSEMDSSAEDFSDNFEKYMQNAILSALVAEKYKPLIEKWYKMFASVMEDGTITDAENEMLHNGGWFVNPTTGESEYSEGWDTITAAGVRDRDALKNQFGWGDKEVYNQEASSGAWQNLGEETGQELNGRFTALQMSGEKLVEAANALIETFNAIYGLSDSQNLTLTEIRNLMITNNAFLEDILEANKKYYEKFEKHLDKIEKSK